jgi:aromatic ring-opening dioxygenase catalytic subunit (LigB family)
MLAREDVANHAVAAPTPVFLFAHGSTMMLGEESEPAKIWEGVGNECLRRGIKRIVMMVSTACQLARPSTNVHRALTGMPPTTQ